MTKKIFINIFFSCIAVLIAAIVIIFGVMYSFYGKELMSELHSEANTVSAGVEESGMDYLNRLNVGSDKRITWINSDGTVKFDTDASTNTMENHFDREEIKEALENGEGEAVRTSDTLSEKTMYCAKLLSDGTIIRVSTNQYTVWVLLLNMFQPLAIVIIITLVLSYATAYFSSRKIVMPINELDLENIDAVTTYEEIEPLVQKIRTQNTVIRKQIKELKRTQAEFAAITGNMKEGMVVIDFNGKILSYNKSAAKLISLSESAENMPIDKLDINQPFAGYIKSSLYGGHISETIEHNDCCLNLFCNPVYVDGKIKGAVAVILDVTEKHKREQLRREFSANVSHELKTPLAAILASAEVIGMEQTPKETDVHFAANIVKEANRLISLVNDIIKLSKLDSSSATLETEQTDLHSIAQNVVERLLPVAKSSKVSLKLIGEKSVMQGMPSILDEVVFNLVDNAIKYNRENGSVNVTVAPVSGKIMLIVEDTGIGIRAEDKERIFERFYRVDKSRSKEVGGTGLGLSIVKHGVEYHNGKLSVESRIGEGTKITVIF